MIKRSGGFWVTAGLGGCLVVLACIATAVFGLAALSQQGFRVAFPLMPGAGVSNRVVIVGNDRNIYLADPTKRAPEALTTDADGGTTREYDFPTLSPDGGRIAFIGYAGDSSASTATVYSLRIGSKGLTPLFQTDRDYPVYLYWAPDSQYLSFLTQKGDGLALRMALPDKQDSSEEVDTGNPLYWSWSPDSKALLMHVDAESPDERLTILDWPGKSNPQSLSVGPGTYQSPQWSADGSKLVYGTSAGGAQEELNIANAQGQQARSVVTYQGRIAFALSPKGNQVAYTITPNAAQVATFAPLQVINEDGTGGKKLTDEPVLAFFWSPDGKRLAYLVPSLTPDENGKTSERIGVLPQQQGDLYLRWKVIDADGSNPRTLATFLPTEQILYVLPFFDQYARSVTFWSPDSKALVYAARDTADTGTVYVVPVEGGKPNAIGDGLLAFWSWK